MAHPLARSLDVGQVALRFFTPSIDRWDATPFDLPQRPIALSPNDGARLDVGMDGRSDVPSPGAEEGDYA
jgi:hypothetical protein